ncbi:phage infection protein [Streptococcus sanguinis SK1 = NCTC 7863]|uniref:Type VII secretion system accessory factor EsaA n=1 Tax=Streptococcus sanguinis SK160 TaxID=888812 RepID=F0IQJ6_STRSA|nr:type VII secretion protein EsaA [Streptococcus sanguinis]EGD40006.1 phage infection protein [Streptococcus sanguinis SK160]EGF04933.1 phage infection protein [Streptococcus sanguinis SK1 = NCTC 7863]ETD06306.1 type VII secretion protein EsaA [Streptococcus sanguinis CC94A]MBZ2076393.1 type VII secretion protein EsaA [Streptococcus sanguinis]RSI01541.1 Chromosome partition protein Smc [Streptococcus sanguinis]
MGNKKLLKYIGNVVLVIALLAAVVTLNVAVQKNTSSARDSKIKTDQKTKLNVAVVNEDRAVKVDKKEYNLGASYVKNLERDDSQNWYIVTRGAADAGLENGKYQLVVTIPSDFSEKVLDVNAISADRTIVTYKVNAAGNQQIENEANSLAKDIIADLNSQLVDMYMASILSNLYTAQQNVQASSEVQVTNIGNYRTNLLESAIGSKNIFPTLVSMSASSVEANNSLKTTLETYAKAFDDLDNSQATYGKNFDSLLKQRADDQVNYAAFMKQLMEMDEKVVHDDTQKLYAKLEETQKDFTKQLGSTDDVKDVDVDNVSQQLQDLETALETERGQLDVHKQQIKDFVDNKLRTYYGVEEGKPITLSAVLGDAITSYDASLKAQIAEAVKALPASQPTEVKFGLPVPALDYSTISQFGTPQGNGSAELDNLAAAAEKAASSTASPVNSQVGKATLSVTPPTGVTIRTITYNGETVTNGQEINLAEGANFNVQFNVANEAAATSVDSSIDISLNGIKVASAPVNVEDAQKAAAAYGAKVQEISSAYQHVMSLIQAYNSFDELKNKDMSESLSTLLINAINSNLDSYQNSLSKSNDGKSQGVKETLDETISNLKNKIEDVKGTNAKLAEEIGEQLKLYENLQTRMSDISKAQASSTDALAKTDTDLSSLNSEFSSLLSSTSGVKSSSQTNVQAADSVNQIFSSFNRELENAQGTTEKLSANAESLMGQFNKELEDNGNFVESFVKVLNNAYENGVPNEVLLDFLSNPVAQSSSSVKATVNVYRPFTWILLLEVVSLFTAYLFATQNIVRKVKDRFKLNKLQDTDIMTVGILGFLSLTIGLVIGIVSSMQLHIGKEYVPSWVLLIVVASFVLIQGQYLFLKHLRVMGMGLAFFMIISFVYLSNAIGTTASLTGFPAFIKSLNALSVLEGMLSGYFDGKTAGFFAIFGLIVLLALLVAANIFIKTRTLKTEEV